MRELRYSVARQGFRVKTVTLFTTLLDPKINTTENLAEAYGLRWTIETSFGHLKTTMTMDVPRCQTVRGILKELTMFLPSCDEGGGEYVEALQVASACYYCS